MLFHRFFIFVVLFFIINEEEFEVVEAEAGGTGKTRQGPPRVVTTRATNTTTLYPGQVPCPPSQHQCDNGQCLNGTRYACDGFPDCLDGSDERECGCRKPDVSCDNSTKCVERKYVCDTFNDCEDGADEVDCANTRCRQNEFRCNSGNCIPLNKKCNGRTECKDESDEIGCSEIVPVCNSSQFGCLNGQCIELHKACNGFYDCDDRSDERPQICMTCKGGMQKYSKASKCDGLRDCMDGSDEDDCETCSATAVKCAPNGKCISRSSYCDRVTDCPDGSDETNCQCPEDMYKCKNHFCISKEYVCDGHPDCPLRDDEEVGMCRRKCGKGKYQCMHGKCIEKEDFCNGEMDCPLGEDESNDFCKHVGACIKGVHWKCGDRKECVYQEFVCDGEKDCEYGEDESREACDKVECKDYQFRCPNEMKCVNMSKHCDGYKDCLDSSDELGCAHMSSRPGADSRVLFVRRKNKMYTLCNDSDDREKQLCIYMAISSKAKMSNISRLEDEYLHARHSFNYYGLKNINRDLFHNRTCAGGAATVNCRNKKMHCGRRMKHMMSTNSTNMASYRWPWYVIIKVGDGTTCGGALIGEKQILTSADCVSKMGVMKPLVNMTAHLATTNFYGMGGVEMTITKINIHPLYDWLKNSHNMAVLTTFFPIAFNDMKQPICLPDALEKHNYRVCYMLGFGAAVLKDTHPPYLMESRVNVLSQKKCIKNFCSSGPNAIPKHHHVDYQHHLCAGYHGAKLGHDICKGSFSGAPLVCQKVNGMWNLLGVGENYHANEDCYMSIFSSVKQNLDFIYSMM